MNNSNQANVSQKMSATVENEPTELEMVLLKLQANLSQLDKCFSYNQERFRQLDAIANQLNPDAFYKNMPSTPSESESCMNKISSYPSQTRSGYIMQINNAVDELSAMIANFDRFTGDEVNKTIRFFNQQLF